jgi:hypothetical protein
MKSILVIFLIIITSFEPKAQGWFVPLPSLPSQPNNLSSVSLEGYNVGSDTIRTMVSYEYGALNKIEEYVILHDHNGQRLDYFQTPTLANKDKSQLSRFLFSHGDLAYHTFIDDQRNEVIECVNLQTRSVAWSKVGYTLKDCISGYIGSYTDILCKTSSGNYEFIDKQSGQITKSLSTDSLEALINSFGQRDSIFEISRIAGDDSIQYFQGFTSTITGSTNIVHSKYEKACDCITADKGIDRQWLWDLQFGFNEPTYTIYDITHIPPDSTFSGSIKLFNFKGDTIINKNITGLAKRESNGTWTSPDISLTRSIDGTYLIESIIGRNGFRFSSPELQTGQKILFFNENNIQINQTEIFYSKDLSIIASRDKLSGQNSFTLRPDSSSTIAVVFGRDMFFGAGLVGIDKNNYHPLTATNVPSQKFQAEIYPNPFNKVVMLQVNRNFKPEEVVIYKLSGKQVERHKWGFGDEIAIKTERLNPGLYLFEIRSENETYRSTCIKLE